MPSITVSQASGDRTTLDSGANLIVQLCDRGPPISIPVYLLGHDPDLVIGRDYTQAYKYSDSKGLETAD